MPRRIDYAEVVADLMTVAEAADELGVTVKTVHRWIESGRLTKAASLKGNGNGVVLLERCEVARATTP